MSATTIRQKSRHTIPVVRTRSRPLEALAGLLISDNQLIEALSTIAARYGEVESVCSLNPNNLDRRLYIVGYRNRESALAASLALGCHIHGNRELVVWLPQSDARLH